VGSAHPPHTIIFLPPPPRRSSSVVFSFPVLVRPSVRALVGRARVRETTMGDESCAHQSITASCLFSCVRRDKTGGGCAVVELLRLSACSATKMSANTDESRSRCSQATLNWTLTTPRPRTVHRCYFDDEENYIRQKRSSTVFYSAASVEDGDL